MNTSLLFFELVIIGFQVIVWLFFGYLAIDKLPLNVVDLGGWENIIAVILLGCSYTIGVLFDRLCDYVFTPWNNLLKKKIIPNPTPNVGTMRFLIEKDNEHLNKFLEYSRSRMRIARACSVNFPLITFTVLAYLSIVKHITLLDHKSIFTLLLGITSTLLALTSWHNITKTHLELILSTYNATKQKQVDCLDGAMPEMLNKLEKQANTTNKRVEHTPQLAK